MSGFLTRIGPANVLHVMAAEPEFGPHLKAMINPLMTGVGPVEAAMVLAAGLAGLKAEGHSVDFVIALGSAGSRVLHQAQVYQVSSVSYRDMDASPVGFEKGVTPFLDQPAELRLDHHIDGLPKARISTGANIVSGAAYDLIDADMVDMESWAHLRVCQQFNVHYIGLRGISDGKDELGHIDDWTQYLHVIDERLAEALVGVHNAIRHDGFEAQ